MRCSRGPRGLLVELVGIPDKHCNELVELLPITKPARCANLHDRAGGDLFAKFGVGRLDDDRASVEIDNLTRDQVCLRVACSFRISLTI